MRPASRSRESTKGWYFVVHPPLQFSRLYVLEMRADRSGFPNAPQYSCVVHLRDLAGFIRVECPEIRRRFTRVNQVLTRHGAKG
jgi:hypothetical protein